MREGEFFMSSGVRAARCSRSAQETVPCGATARTARAAERSRVGGASEARVAFSRRSPLGRAEWTISCDASKRCLTWRSPALRSFIAQRPVGRKVMDHAVFLNLFRSEWHAIYKRRFMSSASNVGRNRNIARQVNWRLKNSLQGIFCVTENVRLVSCDLR